MYHRDGCKSCCEKSSICCTLKVLQFWNKFDVDCEALITSIITDDKIWIYYCKGLPKDSNAFAKVNQKNNLEESDHNILELRYDGQ